PCLPSCHGALVDIGTDPNESAIRTFQSPHLRSLGPLAAITRRVGVVRTASRLSTLVKEDHALDFLLTRLHRAGAFPASLLMPAAESGYGRDSSSTVRIPGIRVGLRKLLSLSPAPDTARTCNLQFHSLKVGLNQLRCRPL